MTRFFVNDREIPSPPPGFSSFHGILEHVEEHYLPPDSVIRQIQVDGLCVLPSELHTTQAGLLDRIEEREKIEFTTGSLREIAYESVQEAVDYLGRIEPIIPSLASGFQTFPEPGMFENLKDLYSGLYWLTLLLNRLGNSLKVPFWEITVQGTSFREHQRKFTSVLRQLVDAQGRGDFVLVADLLEYEILPLLPVWKEVFSSITQSLQTHAAT